MGFCVQLVSDKDHVPYDRMPNKFGRGHHMLLVPEEARGSNEVEVSGAVSVGQESEIGLCYGLCPSLSCLLCLHCETPMLRQI